MSREQRVCMTCHKRFDAINDRQRFCSKPCYLAAKRNRYVPSAIRRPPEPVYIRLPQPLPVFPEFQLTPGVVYKAEKHMSGNVAGDVWNVEDTGMNYAWTGTAWDALGATFEINSITNGEIDTITADT